jgi:hypothetical protein
MSSITEEIAMKLTALILTVALTSPASAADKKLDILGFFPGMAADTFKDRLAALHCDADLCKFDGKVLQVLRSADASIRLVGYRFTSSLKAREQIEATAKEYGAVTRKEDIGDIG